MTLNLPYVNEGLNFLVDAGALVNWQNSLPYFIHLLPPNVCDSLTIIKILHYIPPESKIWQIGNCKPKYK